MFVTTNMGLTAWDQGGDPYDHSQLANNWQAVDRHDHTVGRGVQIPSGGLAPGSVTTSKINNNAVTPDKIPDGSLTQTELAANSVGAPQIIDGSVGNAELAAGSVTSDKVDPNFLPVGSVLAWYRPNGSVPLPSGGWEVCDGRAWSTVTNAWSVSTGSMPDLRNKMILGAGLTGIGSGPTQNPDIGATGGSHIRDLSHAHAVNAHSHTVAGHVHAIGADGNHAHSIFPDGDHVHGISLDGAHNHSMHSRLNAFIQGIQVVDVSSNVRSNTLQSLYVAGFNNGSTDDPVPVEPSHSHGGATWSGGSHNHGGAVTAAGSHSHGGTTGSSTASTSADGATTNSQLSSSTDLRPSYVGLLFIMRVR